MRWLACFALLPLMAHAQTVITGRVLDASSGLPMPYCSVGIVGTNVVTITNEEGAFAIRAHVEQDTLTFSFVGYHKRKVPAQELLEQEEVRLTASVTELRALDVRPASDALYQLVAHCAELLRGSTRDVARLYFEMNTHMDGQPVEVLECFYNAQVDGPHIEGLDLKHGRIGIAPLKDRYFVSLDMTRAMSLLDIRDDGVKFPANPFHFPKVKAMRKHYDITWLGADAGSSATDHLSLVPHDTSGTYFSADVWIDSRTAEPRSIELRCTHCRTHPFIPYKPEDRIDDLDMAVRFTFREGAAHAQLHHMELSYDLHYTDRAGQRQVSTTAVMHLFDRGKPFIPPLFDYDSEQNDYRKITFQPYDSSFWAMAPTLVRTEQQERDRLFFTVHGLLTGSTHVALQRSTLFESNYAWWSAKKRISLKTLPESGTRTSTRPGSGPRSVTIPASSVNLEAQIYLDIDTANGSARHFSATVFDGFRSYYRLPEEPHTDVFFNLFLDLCEMERRAMEEQLANAGTDIARMRIGHAQAVANMRRTTALFLKETDLGADRQALRRWNDKVNEALGIDNMAMFGL